MMNNNGYAPAANGDRPVEPRVARSGWEEEQDETAVALVSFERAAAKDPKLLDARFRIAQISMGYKDFKKAITNYAAVTEVDPKSPAAYVNLGVALKGSGNFQDA